MDTSESDNVGLSSFFSFIHNNNITIIILASILSSKINEVINIFLRNLLVPVINTNNNTPNKKIEDYTMSYNGTNLKIGEFVIKIIECIVIIYVLYIVYVIFKKSNK